MELIEANYSALSYFGNMEAYNSLNEFQHLVREEK